MVSFDKKFQFFRKFSKIFQSFRIFILGWHIATLILLALALFTAFISIFIGIGGCCCGPLTLVFSSITLLTSTSKLFLINAQSFLPFTIAPESFFEFSRQYTQLLLIQERIFTAFMFSL